MEILDTFPHFLKFWADYRTQTIDRQIEGWAGAYMADYPELLAKQVEDYSEQNLDWKTIAREKVFPFIETRLPAMIQAHKNLLELGPSLYFKAQQILEFESDIVFVIHVGIGCGAGWVTPYQGRPAILFGLENVAECGWIGTEAISGLVAHEIGHVLHAQLRAQNERAVWTGAWWQLYEEGFAQRCETLIRGDLSWHQASADCEWLTWCQRQRGWLAAEFLKTAAEGRPVNPFFGSWFEIQGKSETGYFLGHEVIRELEQQYSLKEIAVLETIEAHVKPILERMQAA